MAASTGIIISTKTTIVHVFIYIAQKKKGQQKRARKIDNGVLWGKRNWTVSTAEASKEDAHGRFAIPAPRQVAHTYYRYLFFFHTHFFYTPKDTRTHTHVPAPCQHTHMHIYTLTHMHIYTLTHTHTHAHTHTHTGTRTHTR